MMRAILGRELVSRQIIDAIHGRLLGHVEEIYYDAYLAEIVALSLGHDAAGAHGIVKSEDIRLLGTNAVLVKHSNVAIVADTLPEAWLIRRELLGAEVRTLEGKRLGTVDDFAADAQSLLLSFFVLRLDPAPAGGPTVAELPVSAIRALSFDGRLVVDSNVESEKSHRLHRK